jgi:hypothetical protein
MPQYDNFTTPMSAGDALSKLNGSMDSVVGHNHNPAQTGNGAKIPTSALSGSIAGGSISGAVASTDNADKLDNYHADENAANSTVAARTNNGALKCTSLFNNKGIGISSYHSFTTSNTRNDVYSAITAVLPTQILIYYHCSGTIEGKQVVAVQVAQTYLSFVYFDGTRFECTSSNILPLSSNAFIVI